MMIMKGDDSSCSNLEGNITELTELSIKFKEQERGEKEKR